MIIDFHSHCNVGDPENVARFVENCRSLGVRAALSGGPRYGAEDFQPNEFVLKLSRKYPDAIIPMARVDLWDKVDPDQVRRFADAGYKGLKFIYPYYEYDHDLYMPMYAAAEECGLPCLFHTGIFRPSEADIRWKRPVMLNMNPLHLDRVARSFQKLHVVMAHMGTSLWRHEASSMLGIHANVYSDLAGSGSWMGVSAEHLYSLLHPFYFLGDPDWGCYRKIVFGSDSYVSHPGIMNDALMHYRVMLKAVPDEIRNAVLGNTAASWFGIKE